MKFVSFLKSSLLFNIFYFPFPLLTKPSVGFKIRNVQDNTSYVRELNGKFSRVCMAVPNKTKLPDKTNLEDLQKLRHSCIVTCL